MFAICHGKVWHLDDFSDCFQHDYLQTLFPLIACALSILFLIYQLFREALNSKYYHAYTLLNHWRHPWDFRIPPPGGPAATRDQDEDDSDDEMDRNAQLALNPTLSQANKTTLVEAAKPKGEVLRVFLEFLAVVGELVISVVAFATGAWGRHGRIAAAAGVAVWSYIIALALARLVISVSPRLSFPYIWFHTTYLYSLQWLCTVMLFRSYIIHPGTRANAQPLIIVDFILVTFLVLIALSSRVGNKTVEIEYEGDIPPAREPLASVFSKATFSWVDSIVWHGYKHTYQLPDVWNVAPEDKASTILSQYRQVKKTSILAWHLLKHFKVGLLVQAGWACGSGFLTFAPTLLLRSILQYVERPDEIPANSAWFFVILLFVSGCASALADGMALWVGRKICIRLRAIIVGEIYAKALRRKTGASSDKVLGQDKAVDLSKESTWQKIKRFGRKKKAQAASQQTNGASNEEDTQVTSGAIINLMAVDSFKVSDISAYLHFLWASTPVQAVVAIVLLYQILGFSSIAGIGMMILLLPVNLVISKQFAAIQKKILAATDARINTTNEILTNIRIIKYFAWERRFMDNIDEKRTTELARLRYRYILWSVAATIWGGAPVLITFLSFAVYTMVEQKALIPSIAFTALSLFQILRIPLDQLADMVAHVQEAKVSVDRIEEFLNEEDTQKYKQLRPSESDVDEHGDPVIGFDKATFAWGSKASMEQDSQSSFKMMDLDLRFAVGRLNVIAGPTGSGKTSLLMALLGEMTLLEGRVHLPSGSREDITRNAATGLTESVAYCSQQAWLVNDNIKQNIVFASPWSPNRYREVVAACALEKDFEILDNGDETLVGEKGVTLSGGQKQRISLARALYSSARHILLDDVLSAVDSHSQKWIFDKALMGPLMRNRTCILVTHSVSLCLPEAEYAVVLDNGRVTISGLAKNVISSGKLSEDLTKSAPPSARPSRVQSSANLENEDHAEGANGSAVVNGQLDPNHARDKHDTPTAGPAKATLTPSKTALDENKAEGSVKLKTITMYFTAMGGWWFWSFAAVVFAAQQLSNVSTNVWIRQWANAYADREYGYDIASKQHQTPVTYVRGVSGWSSCLQGGSCTWNIPSFSKSGDHLSIAALEEVDAAYYLAVYAILGVLYMAITFSREWILFLGSLSASKTIHSKLVESVARAKFRFFDTTPLGQIMNRFSKDIENIDQEIAPIAVGVVHCMASIITIVILISVITPGFLVAGVFISILYFLIGKFYINSSRDLKRLESIQRSPLYQQFGETLTGMTTIRAYGDERRFIRENLNKVNTHNRPFIYLWAANRWLAFRVDVAGALVSFFAGVFVVLSVGNIDAGAAGLAMTYAVTFTENVLWFVRLYAANEQNMNSVERIKEYLDVEQEAPALMPENRPPADWPSKGAVEIVGYTTRYRSDFEPVLRNINLKLSPCEKIGVVGRTGAGKSSLALALFRALEAEKGKIVIDGVEVGLIGLQDLRENIVMVPQDPTLFTGTIRSNLDPFSLFTDEEIFTALRRVQLIGSALSSETNTRPQTPLPSDLSGNKKAVDKSASSSDTAVNSSSEPSNSLEDPLPSVAAHTHTENRNIFRNLSSNVAESGSNLSQGQRQLLCLARAMLKNPKVLLMDEATASIDYATDAKIQETIRELNDSTIITIAHRLKTIVDYDRVVVLDAGEVKEVGEPWELIKPLDGEPTGKRWFREMCETSGEIEILEREAKKSYDAKRLVDV